ncbi:MAG: hypothetical protein UDN35_08385 [Oscillospiraceae bacterium]|jgi:predicted transcriptional regulator|nr:hypothetical protein [Oscillospiraceae bacterium]
MSNRKIMIGFKADTEVKDELDKIADLEDRSVSYIVNKFVVQGIKKYAEDKKEEGSRALEVLDYIEHLDFTSYADFVKQTTQQKTYNWINNNLGVLQTYMIVCEKLNIPADQRVIDEISLDQAAQDADEDDY